MGFFRGVSRGLLTPEVFRKALDGYIEVLGAF